KLVAEAIFFVHRFLSRVFWPAFLVARSSFRVFNPLRSGAPRAISLEHFLDELAATRFFDCFLELGSEVRAHFLGALLGPQPDVARIAVKRFVARPRSIELRQPRRLARNHRE